MKPSQRRDSLEKAARKGIVKLDAVESPLVGDVVQFVASFAQRHGAKVRRETRREAAQAIRAVVGTAHTYASENADIYRAYDHGLLEAAKIVLSLTPRGPEKGRKR